MRFRLIGKFAVVYVAVAILSFILVSTLGSSLVTNNIIKEKSKALFYTAQEISEDLPENKSTLNSVYKELKALAAYQNTQIWLLSDDGEIIINTAADFSDKRVSVKGFDRIALGTGYYFIGNFFNYFSEEMLSVIAPVSSSFSVSGYIVIHMPMSEIIKSRESILLSSHITMIFTFAALLFILLFIYLWIMRPLGKITKGAKEFASGNLKYKINLKTGDEFEYLSETLDYMASDLDKNQDYQRAFIANISHDFRSPLTSIRGYAEAISDGTIPPEMYPKYLGIVISEADRLTKLSQEMLTLDQVNQKTAVLDISEFNINKLISDTAASFEVLCTNKKIILDLTFEEESLIVKADYAKIQQVMYNLLDNAIKFSKNNSSIELETYEKYNKAYIIVRDHGIGIAPKDIQKIWDRFYKSDLSRGKNPKGSGLGLAIVKDIITAHNQKINVVSTIDVGTEFYFTLACADT